jgi:hypothetical protein
MHVVSPYVQVFVASDLSAVTIFGFSDAACGTLAEALRKPTGTCTDFELKISAPAQAGPVSPTYPPAGWGVFQSCEDVSSRAFPSSSLGVCRSDPRVSQSDAQFCAPAADGQTYFTRAVFIDTACSRLGSLYKSETAVCLHGFQITCPAGKGAQPPSFPPTQVVLQRWVRKEEGGAKMRDEEANLKAHPYCVRLSQVFVLPISVCRPGI